MSNAIETRVSLSESDNIYFLLGSELCAIMRCFYCTVPSVNMQSQMPCLASKSYQMLLLLCYGNSELTEKGKIFLQKYFRW